MKHNDTEWVYSDAWAAGFFDGEGCITIDGGKLRQYSHVSVQVVQKARAPLDEFAGLFGGGVSSTQNGDKCYRWRIRGRKAVRFLEVVRPWLLVKGAQADIAFEFAKSKTKGNQKLTESQINQRLQIIDRLKAAKKVVN